MGKYFEQLQKDFSDWGHVFTTSTLMDEPPSPFKRLKEKGFSINNSRLVFCVCPDDIDRLSERKTVESSLKEAFGGEFHLGNLGAYPIGGVTGITAASHHPPDDNGGSDRKQGNLIFFISPHLGLYIENEVLYGKIQRPGQMILTNSCGAMMGFLETLKHVENVRDIEDIKDDDDDPTRIILFRALLDGYKEELLENLHSQDINITIIKLARINYDLVMQKFKSMLAIFMERETFTGEIAIVGGITINTKDKDYFIFRDYTLNLL